LAKIKEVLPAEARDGMGAVPLRVGPATLDAEDLSQLRDAIRHERKMEIRYRDVSGHESMRVIWPFAIGYFADGRLLVGWCEKRNDYRHFRTDRLLSVRVLDERYARRRAQMFRDWLKRQKDKEIGAADNRPSPDHG
jgi:predicted DNA-binding transcriptional regulator YafY